MTLDNKFFEALHQKDRISFVTGTIQHTTPSSIRMIDDGQTSTDIIVRAVGSML